MGFFLSLAQSTYHVQRASERENIIAHETAKSVVLTQFVKLRLPHSYIVVLKIPSVKILYPQKECA
jgi:hypothetical protein